jgi:uncharacterized protein YycO
MIHLQFVLGTGLPSRGIAWFSAGHFSHVDAILPDGSLLGARSDQIGLVPPGVQIRPPYYETWKERVVMTLPASSIYDSQFYAFLKLQLGKPYDKTAIWGFVSGRDWREEDSWFCSELLSAALEVSGACPNLYAPRNKITPAALATVMSALKALF